MQKSKIISDLKKRMQKDGISNYRLAKLIEENESKIHKNFKEDSEMSLTTFVKICNVLNINIDIK